MRHRVYGKHLGRNKDERRSLFNGLVRSLFSYGTIQTSEVKAKAIKGLVDKIINAAKDKTSGQLQSLINDKEIRERLVKEIVPKLGVRTSGYSSMVKIGARSGDQTMMVKLSLIGAEELKPVQKELRVKSQESSKKNTRELKIEKEIVKSKLPKRITKTSATKGRRKS